MAYYLDPEGKTYSTLAGAESGLRAYFRRNGITDFSEVSERPRPDGSVTYVASSDENVRATVGLIVPETAEVPPLPAKPDLRRQHVVWSYSDSHGTEWEIFVWRRAGATARFVYEANLRLSGINDYSGYPNHADDVWYGTPDLWTLETQAVNEMAEMAENANRVSANPVTLVRK